MFCDGNVQTATVINNGVVCPRPATRAPRPACAICNMLPKRMKNEYCHENQRKNCIYNEFRKIFSKQISIMSQKHRWTCPKSPLQHHQLITKTLPKHHQRITKTSPRHHKDTPKTSPKHKKSCTFCRKRFFPTRCSNKSENMNTKPPRHEQWRGGPSRSP